MKTPDGFLVVDKPRGVTSAEVIRTVTRQHREWIAGHLGTLDPLATGVLVLLVGNARKLMSYYLHGRKRYVADITFGQSTTTYDAEGEPALTAEVPDDMESRLMTAVGSFTGPQKQVPPVYSAIKTGGRRAYELARKGRNVELEPRLVEFYSIEVVKKTACDTWQLDVSCSAGTYIRSLAHDLGMATGVPAHLSGLRRVESAPFDLSMSVPLDLIAESTSQEAGDLLIPLSRIPPPGRPVILTEDELRRVMCGVGPELDARFDGLAPGSIVSYVAAPDVLVAVGEVPLAESGAEFEVPSLEGGTVMNRSVVRRVILPGYPEGY